MSILIEQCVWGKEEKKITRKRKILPILLSSYDVLGVVASVR
jgi:hypothetical protein